MFETFKVAVVGSRQFADYNKLSSTIHQILSHYDFDHPQHIKVEFVSGGASGADQLCEKYAKDNGCSIKIFHANWNLYGKKAGPLRNQQIVNYADIIIAFWNGRSRGTKNTLTLAKQLSKKHYICKF
jgi:predicted Rossmann fold nucleotide-binding protein DprA/Smf involved in DNA uptake